MSSPKKDESSVHKTRTGTGERTSSAARKGERLPSSTSRASAEGEGEGKKKPLTKAERRALQVRSWTSQKKDYKATSS